MFRVGFREEVVNFLQDIEDFELRAPLIVNDGNADIVSRFHVVLNVWMIGLCGDSDLWRFEGVFLRHLKRDVENSFLIRCLVGANNLCLPFEQFISLERNLHPRLRLCAEITKFLLETFSHHCWSNLILYKEEIERVVFFVLVDTEMMISLYVTFKRFMYRRCPKPAALFGGRMFVFHSWTRSCRSLNKRLLKMILLSCMSFTGNLDKMSAVVEVITRGG